MRRPHPLGTFGRHRAGPQALTPLDAATIATELGRLGSTLGRPLSIAPVTGSTNDDARAAAVAGAPHGAAFLADAQTKGRGRRGHTWHSPAGENLYLSLVLRPRVAPAAVSATTLAIGVAVARVVEDTTQGAAPIWVKWPNDVLAGSDKKKIAGVLVEGQIRGAEVTSVVAGVGVNVHAMSFPDDIAHRATSLAILGADIDRSLLAARVIVAIAEAAARFERDGLASIMADLARLDALRGLEVEVSGTRGRADGIDAEGRLLVRDASSVTPIVAGEVSVVSELSRR